MSSEGGKKRKGEEGAEGAAPAKKSKLETTVLALLGASSPQKCVAISIEACPSSENVALAAFKKVVELGSVEGAEKQIAAAFVDHGDTSAEHCKEGIVALCLIESWAVVDAPATLGAALAAAKEHETLGDIGKLAVAALSTGEGDIADTVAEILEEVEGDPTTVTQIAVGLIDKLASENLVVAVAAAARTHSLANKEALEACANALVDYCKREDLVEHVRKTKIAKVFKRAGIAPEVAELAE